MDEKKTSQHLDNSAVCIEIKHEEVDEAFIPNKRVLKTTQLWIIINICSQLSIFQLQPKHGPVFIWSPLLDLCGLFLQWFFCAHHCVACTWLCIIFLPFWCMLDLLNLSHWSVHSIIGIPFIRVVFVFACGKGATTWRVMNKESQASNLNLLNFLSAC